MPTNRELFLFAVQAGEVLLKNGAEIFRAQETIARILEAFGIKDYSLYVLSNGIFASVNEGEEHCCVAIRDIPAATFHLGRVAAINELSRQIVREADPEKLEGYQTKLQESAVIPHFPLPLRMLAGGIGSGGFCFLLGGGTLDALAGFFCGVALQLFLFFYGRRNLSRFMHTILGSVLVSSMAVGIKALFPALSLDFIIIGAIMAMVPGVSLTTSIRDFFNGDFLSGTIHLIDAVLTAVCIAVGVVVSLGFWQYVSGGVFL